MSQQSTLPASAATQTARLLACGIAAGPLFLTVGLTQAFIRDGFDLSRHPLSLLSLGGWGGSRSPTSWWPAGCTWPAPSACGRCCASAAVAPGARCWSEAWGSG
jgi:hypothetical protein